MRVVLYTTVLYQVCGDNFTGRNLAYVSDSNTFTHVYIYPVNNFEGGYLWTNYLSYLEELPQITLGTYCYLLVTPCYSQSVQVKMDVELMDSVNEQVKGHAKTGVPLKR